jgi:hypothetical protein
MAPKGGIVGRRLRATALAVVVNDPSTPGTDFGVAELAGLKNARIFDPATNSWTPSGKMSFARLYPSLVTLPDGKILVASGVSKLLKPVYPDHPFDSGTNVKQLEVYDPASGQWTALPESANRSLPLFPRLHLLPNGHVYYDVAGQSFNPFGQSYDEALGTWRRRSTLRRTAGATSGSPVWASCRPRRTCPGRTTAISPGCRSSTRRRSTGSRKRVVRPWTRASGSAGRRSRRCCRSSPTPPATTRRRRSSRPAAQPARWRRRPARRSERT